MSARVELLLIGRITPEHRLAELAVRVRHRLGDALAAVFLFPVAQLDRLVHACRGAGWDGRAADGTGLEKHVDLDRGIAP